MTTTTKKSAIGAALASLLGYPDETFAGRLDAAHLAVKSFGAEAAAHLERFCVALRPLSQDEREELYTRTFDISPLGALEIGWHLFGEDYHRGALLVRLRTELRRHRIEEAGELPDHLTRVLVLLDRMAEDEAKDFAHACVTPALEKMLNGFERKENPFEHLLRCVVSVLATRFGRQSETNQGLKGELPRLSLPIVDDDSRLQGSNWERPRCEALPRPSIAPSGS